MPILLILLAILMLCVAWTVGAFRHPVVFLGAFRSAFKSAVARIDVQLQRCFDRCFHRTEIAWARQPREHESPGAVVAAPCGFAMRCH